MNSVTTFLFIGMTLQNYIEWDIDVSLAEKDVPNQEKSFFFCFGDNSFSL